jgi:hypothetical protein
MASQSSADITMPAGNNPTQSTRKKQNAVADFKSLQLEQEFKTKHLGVLGVLVWIL